MEPLFSIFAGGTLYFTDGRKKDYRKFKKEKKEKYQNLKPKSASISGP